MTPQADLRLTTERLVLRPLNGDDARDLRRLAGEWEVARNTGRIPHPYPIAAARAYIANARRNWASGREYAFAITEATGGALVGCIGLEPGTHGNEIGYWVGQPFWGRGYATEALERVVRFAFDTLGLDRVTASVLADNGASRRVLEKTAMVPAGATSRLAPARGGHRDLLLYERRRPEPVARALPLLLVVAVALVDDDNRVLIARRPEGRAMAGLWEFPGGKVGAEESPEDALIRELDEELGIQVRKPCLAPASFASHPYDSFHLLMPLYVCRRWAGQVTPREHAELAWVRPAALRDYPMPPADGPLIPALCDLLQ